MTRSVEVGDPCGMLAVVSVRLLIAPLAVVGLLAGSVGVAAAQTGEPEAPPSTDRVEQMEPLPQGAGDIVQKPDSGAEPDDAGDRGGSLQVAVFWLILLAVVVVGLLAWRDSRRSRERHGEAGPGAIRG